MKIFLKDVLQLRGREKNEQIFKHANPIVIIFLQ